MMRPWKLITLAIGLGILCYGSIYEQLGDWDIGVSLLMGILTYLTAPWCIKVFYRRQWALMPLALFCAWFTIDGSYVAYNILAGHMYVREANAIASTPLYFMMGFFWLYEGTISECIYSIRTLCSRQRLHQPQ